MKNTNKLSSSAIRVISLGMLIAAGIGGAAAQEPPRDDFPGPPPFGGPGGPGGGGPSRQRGPERLTVATAPASALEAYLALTPEQGDKLTGIISDLKAARPRPGPPPGAGGDADADAPQRPTREQMMAARVKFEAAITHATEQITAILDDRQKTRLPVVMKAFAALQADSISLNAASMLRLTTAQVESLAALGSTADHVAVTGLLTAEQNEVADLNRRRNRPMRGGPGGGPGGPGGGFGPPDGQRTDGPPPF